MNKRSPFRVSLIAAALASVSGLAAAAVTDNSGSTVDSNTAQCVGNVYGTNCSPAANPDMSSAAFAPVAPAEAANAPEPTPRSDIAALTPGPMTSTPRVPAENGYVTDNTGRAARTVNGGCLTSNTGAVNYGVAECGGVVAAAPAPLPPQAPTAQVAPQQREVPLKRITLDTDTTFNFDSADLTKEGQDQLNNIVDAAKNENVARLRIHVTGYTDRIGTVDYNQKLSERRADAVREYFVGQGLPADVITSEGRGKANPVVQCEGMKGVSLIECLRPNRRSEVEFAALERAEPATSQQAPGQPAPAQPWEPGTDTGTPR